MDFNINGEVRKVFELLDKSRNLRRIVYALIVLAAFWRLPEILAALK